jgi:hypothetical protein
MDFIAGILLFKKKANTISARMEQLVGDIIFFFY